MLKKPFIQSPPIKSLMSASFGALNIFGRLIFAFGGTSGVFSAFRFSGSSARTIKTALSISVCSTLRLKAIKSAPTPKLA